MRYLGKKEHVPGAISWRYRDIFDRKHLMKPPLVFGHIWNDTVIDMLGNDKAGCCVWSTQAHILQTMQRGLANDNVTQFSETSVLGDYSAATGFVRGDPKTDQGTNMADAASYWRKTGITDAHGRKHFIDAYVQVEFHDVDELMQACFDFGGLGLGVQLPKSADDQFDWGEPWTIVRNSPILGGHATELAGRNSDGDAVIATWNGITGADMRWIQEYADEAVAFFSLEYLDKRGLNPGGYDRTEIVKRLEALGRTYTTDSAPSR